MSKPDVLAIRSINKKLHFNAVKLAQLEDAQKQGVPANEALANLLGMSDGQDSKAYLRSKLNDHEYQVLKRFLGYSTDGSPLDD
jgi:hypothetical protein